MTKYGFTAEQVKNFSDAQIVVIDLVRRFRGRHEEAMLPMRLPYPEALAMTKALDKKYPDDKVDRFDMVEIMNRLLLPAVGRVRNADIRLDRQIAMLRTIEAIRLYAAENKGKLPEKLKAAAELVSIPTDPATAKPFVYRADGKKFTLTAPPFDGAPPSVANTVEYTVTIER